MSLSAKNNSTSTETCCKLTDDFEILRNLPLFAGADPEVTKLFAYLAKRRIYQPGDYIIESGKEANRSLLLVSGEAEVTTTHDGKEVIIQKLTSNAFIGELALLARFHWYFNVRAVAETDLMIIDRKSFKKVLSRFPNRREQIIEKIIQLRVSRLKHQANIFLDQITKLQPDKITTINMPI